MPSLIEEDENVPKERLFITICIIMLLEYNTLGLDEIINLTGLSFNDVRAAMQNLVLLKLVNVLPGYKTFPKFELISEKEAEDFLKMVNV